MSKYTKHFLLKIARIQQIDYNLTSKGISREFVFNKIIYPNFFITRKSYYNYLGINAKAILREEFNADWERELRNLKPVNYVQLMKELESQNFFDFENEPLSSEERLNVIQKGIKQ